MAEPKRIVDPMIAELEQESEATRRMLERVPADKLDWSPHPKSMTLGQLAFHIAGIGQGIGEFLELDGLDVAGADFEPGAPASHREIMEKFEQAKAAARVRLEGMDDEEAARPWRLTNDGDEIFTMPKAALARTLMFNHLYHHRGQLSVYLRLLDVPVPVTYGRSADEDGFG